MSAERTANQRAATAVAPAVDRPPTSSVPVAVPADPRVRVALSCRLDPPDAVLGDGNVSLVVGSVGGAQVLAARRALLAAVGLDLDRAVFAEQVHGAGVARVGRADRGRGALDHADAIPDADALVTTDSGIGLVVMAADCVPVVLVAPGAGVAAVHVGRLGVTAGVVSAAVGALVRATRGAAGALTAILGPAIGGCCYEVPLDMADALASQVPAAQAVTDRGTPGLDLPAAVQAQLADCCVGEVVRMAGCTRCDLRSARFSHRAAQEGDRPQGRQALVVARLGDL